MKLKKTLALLLSLMMVISLAVPAWATDLDSTNEGNQVEIEPDDESSVDEVQPDEELNGAENGGTIIFNTTLEEQVAAVSAKLTSTESGKATFNAKWSLPEGSTISSVKIYRGSSSADKVVAESTLTSKGSVHNVNLFVRNGDYTLNLTGLTPGKWQHALIQIKYNDKNGNPQTLTSTVQKVQVHS